MKCGLLLFTFLFCIIIVAGCSSSHSNKDIPKTTSATHITTHPTSQITRITPQITTESPHPTITVKTTILTEKMTATPISASRVSGTCTCTADTYNCKDFSSHAVAQACYDYCKSIGQGDIHKLDANNDANACEGLS
jgi:hypothetical protein